MTLVTYIGAAWLVTLLVGIFAPREKDAEGLRWPEILVLVTTLACGAVLGYELFSPAKAARNKTADGKATIGSCASVTTGELEENVRSRLGQPTETRSEEELRGPNAKVWIYRDSRCAVHILGGIVESVE